MPPPQTNYLAVLPSKVIVPLPNAELPELVEMVVDGILKASDFSADEAQVNDCASPPSNWPSESTRRGSDCAASFFRMREGHYHCWRSAHDSRLGHRARQCCAHRQGRFGAVSDAGHEWEQVMAWEEKRLVSKYAKDLVQVDNGKKISPDRESTSLAPSSPRGYAILDLARPTRP